MKNQENNILRVKSYEIYMDRKIGEGQFGIVYQCQDNSNPELKLCAKLIRENLQDPKIKGEIKLMEMIMNCGKANKNIVGMEYVEYNDDRILLIMERCESDLQKIINDKKLNESKYFTPNEALNLLKQVINGYKVLYSNNIIHKNLKPQNILFLNGVYKIADLGLARVLEAIEKTIQKFPKVCTSKYAAPQLFFDSQFSNQADIFSLGIIIYELIFGGLPYKVLNIIQVKADLKNIEINPIKVNRFVQGMTEEFALLIEDMLKFQEVERISWEQLFKHSLIQDEFNVVINQSGLIQEILDDQEDEKQIIQQKQNPPNDPSIENQLITQNSKQFKKFPTFPTQNTSNTPQMSQSPQFSSKTQFSKTVPTQPFVITPRLKFHIFGQPLIFINDILTVSDQLFQAGFFLNQILEFLDQFINIQYSLRHEFFAFKLYLHCLAECFFQHSKAKKCQPQNRCAPSYYSIQIIEHEIQKQHKIHQVIDEEIKQFNLALIYPVQNITPDYVQYLQKLKSVGQVKTVFSYNANRKYFLDYLQIVYCLERLNDCHPNNFSDFYQFISDINKNYKNEVLIVNYLNNLNR
ncbi:unnamed protein product [Paramecium sonneborni]|uniref:Protein kinase domain-containing protein n=1 Tax=Paramecium sonneborni TaxID=65129 RepID=A0A8S1RA65_9CILI|nr:unnamed protein product [Paramecium sonneborni]